MVKQESEARVGPVVEFANTGEGEQGKSPLIRIRAQFDYELSKQRIKPTPTLSKSE